jgi:hypothetical protein
MRARKPSLRKHLCASLAILLCGAVAALPESPTDQTAPGSALLLPARLPSSLVAEAEGGGSFCFVPARSAARLSYARLDLSPGDLC